MWFEPSCGLRGVGDLQRLEQLRVHQRLGLPLGVLGQAEGLQAAGAAQEDPDLVRQCSTHPGGVESSGVESGVESGEWRVEWSGEERRVESGEWSGEWSGLGNWKASRDVTLWLRGGRTHLGAELYRAMFARKEPNI